MLNEINALRKLDSEFILHSEAWRSLVGLDISFDFYFVSKLSTTKGLFLILDQNKWVVRGSRFWLGTFNW